MKFHCVIFIRLFDIILKTSIKIQLEKLCLSPNLYGKSDRFSYTIKLKLHSVECFLHGMLVPQGYDLKALEPIGHLSAVFSHLDLLYQLKILKWKSYGTLHAG